MTAKIKGTGLIPAHAGKTITEAHVKELVEAHPRSRGENGYLSVFRVTGLGSSPLTRGKLRVCVCAVVRCRLIPAHAGKTGRTVTRAPRPTAHPRSRGENLPSSRRDVWASGSSPLTRGKPQGSTEHARASRLIPAHAGKTSSACSASTNSTAHPRSRGENSCPHHTTTRPLGSSPLTRGKLNPLRIVFVVTGLIPAHAGKTGTTQQRPRPPPAHPRSRGENSMRRWPLIPSSGSSPLTRGKHFLTCAFTAQIDQILETLELAASFGSYLIWVACATDAPQDPVRSIGLVLPSSMGAS